MADAKVRKTATFSRRSAYVKFVGQVYCIAFLIKRDSNPDDAIQYVNGEIAKLERRYIDSDITAFKLRLFIWTWKTLEYGLSEISGLIVDRAPQPAVEISYL